MIELRDVCRSYMVGGSEVHAVQHVNLRVAAGEHIAIMGPSGSGKSTLLHILGCLDRPSSGLYRFRGRNVGTLSDDERSNLRQHEIGFVFQFFYLLGRLTAGANVELPMLFAGVPKSERTRRAVEALKAVGLADRMHHHPDQLSGGQRQRVAIARALVMRPSLLLADEPTGNLDRSSAEEVMTLLERLRAGDRTLIVVTHDPEIAQRAQRIVRMSDGRIEETAT